MDALHWSADYSTGVPFLDDQHRSIFAAAEELGTRLQGGDDRAEALRLMAFLRRYTIRHFAAEESLLQHVGYPELARHRAIHAEIAYEILEAEVGVREGRMAPGSASLQPLLRRILTHITSTDAEYTPFTRQSRTLVQGGPSDLPQIGIPSLDQEHRGFLDILAQLQDAEDGGAGPGMLPEVFAQLRSYAEVHFGKEDLLMDLTDYPGAEQHRSFHRAFLARVEALEARAGDPGHPVSAATLAFLRDWMLEHISREDRAIGEHLRRSGLPGTLP